MTPQGSVARTTLGKQHVNMRIPFQVSAECMEYTDKSGSEVLGFVQFVKHSQNYVTHRMKQTVEQVSVFAEKVTQFLRNSENAMSVPTVYEFTRHRGGTSSAIQISASGTKPTFTAERHCFRSPAFFAAV